MEFNAVVKTVERVSKQGKPYTILEIYVGGKLVKSDIFLNSSEILLLELLG